MAQHPSTSRLTTADSGKMMARFARDETGAVLIVFALALIPILSLTGLAVDHGRASSMKAGLQRDLDVAVLAGAQKLAETGKAKAAEYAARQRFQTTNAARLDADVSFVADAKTGKLTAKARHAVPTLFLAVAGLEKLDIEAGATARVTPPKPGTTAAAKAAAPAAAATKPKVEIDDYELSRLIGRVRDVCMRLETQGLGNIVPQCAPIFDGSFERRLRHAIATNADPSTLLPAGISLVE